MYKQSLELNKFGLSAMSENEMLATEGGRGFWSWLMIAGAAVLAVGLTLGTGGLALVAAGTAATIEEVGVGMIVVGAIGEAS